MNFVYVCVFFFKLVSAYVLACVSLCVVFVFVNVFVGVGVCLPMAILSSAGIKGVHDRTQLYYGL